MAQEDNQTLKDLQRLLSERGVHMDVHELCVKILVGEREFSISHFALEPFIGEVQQKETETPYRGKMRI